ncbi:MAG: hypothetical protein WD317_03145 [Balneolaceae bacterium]
MRRYLLNYKKRFQMDYKNGLYSGKFLRRLALLLCFVLQGTSVLKAQSATSNEPSVVEYEMNALEVYQTGFARDVMKTATGHAVRLNNHVLYENDAPGAGWSLKGTFLEPVHEDVLARKQFYLEDIRAKKAHIVFYMMKAGSGEAAPYHLVVNGTRLPGTTPSWHEPNWRWVEIPTQLLKEGLNEVIIGSDAPEGEGYELLFAREDEYEGGGGKFTFNGSTALISADQIRPASEGDLPGLEIIEVGATSAKSIDGGETWHDGKLGPDNSITGEYTIRLHLERYKPEGRFASSAIDLWQDPDDPSEILPKTQIERLEVTVDASVHEETEIEWQYRMADTPDMLDEAWGKWKTLGSGEDTTFEPDPEGKRYFQWQAVLKSENPLQTPVVNAVTVRSRLRPSIVPEDTYYVRGAENVDHRYSSYRITYEDAEHPGLHELSERLELDTLFVDAVGSDWQSQGGDSSGNGAGTEGMTESGVLYGETRGGDFSKMNRLRHFVSGLWYHELPDTEYPEWNAHEILDRNERLGAGGMCIQFSIVFMQALQSMGYNARHVNMFAHETIEVYVDELEKWVMLDPESVFDSYQFQTETGMPVHALDQHHYFLKELGLSSSNPIDWTSPEPWTSWGAKGRELFPQPLNFSTFTPHINNPNQPPPLHKLAGFLRLIPRSDFLSRPTPRPVNQGLNIHWPWNGYINWYDEATPRKLQYSLHTDRAADLYPTLNRVQYQAVYNDTSGTTGEVDIQLVTNTPNFDTFEINIDDQGWQAAPSEFTWKLQPASVNTLEMRTRNKVGKTGKASRLELLWHYREPFQPRQAEAD